MYCKDCHTGIERTLEEMADVPVQRGAGGQILIQIEEDARAKGVPLIIKHTRKIPVHARPATTRH